MSIASLDREKTRLVVVGYLQAKADSAIFAPDLQRRYQQSADALLDDGEVSSALEELRSLRDGCRVGLKTNPGDEHLKRELSQLNFWMDQLGTGPKEAVIWLRNQANRLDPAAVADDYNQAADDLEIGKRGRAIVLIERALMRSPGEYAMLHRLLRDIRG